MAGFCEYGNGPLGSVQAGNFLSRRVEIPCIMKLVIQMCRLVGFMWICCLLTSLIFAYFWFPLYHSFVSLYSFQIVCTLLCGAVLYHMLLGVQT
jgi:hypothetical protein